MANGNGSSNEGMMADVQRALSFALIGSFAVALLSMTFKLVWSGSVEQNIDILKIAFPAAITFAGTVLGYFYGSTKSKDTSDAAQAGLMDKLTPTAAPTPPTAPVPPWWARLTEDEKNAITAAAGADPRVQAFVTASQVGAATKDDLDYLVSKNLLTAERATAIAAA